MYPPTLAMRLLGQKESISDRNLEFALLRLVELTFVRKDVTSYTDKPLKRQTRVFCISDFGRLALKK
jgi:hypothetical protein